MKSKDQVLLEEAYKKVQTLFKDKKDQYLSHGDIVIYNKMKFKVVGGKSVLGTGIDHDMVQLEQIEDVNGIPKLIWARPKQLLKIK